MKKRQAKANAKKKSNQLLTAGIVAQKQWDDEQIKNIFQSIKKQLVSNESTDSATLAYKYKALLCTPADINKIIKTVKSTPGQICELFKDQLNDIVKLAFITFELKPDIKDIKKHLKSEYADMMLKLDVPITPELKNKIIFKIAQNIYSNVSFHAKYSSVTHLISHGKDGQFLSDLVRILFSSQAQKLMQKSPFMWKSIANSMSKCQNAEDLKEIIDFCLKAKGSIINWEGRVSLKNDKVSLCHFTAIFANFKHNVAKQFIQLVEHLESFKYKDIQAIKYTLSVLSECFKNAVPLDNEIIVGGQKVSTFNIAQLAKTIYQSFSSYLDSCETNIAPAEKDINITSSINPQDPGLISFKISLNKIPVGEFSIPGRLEGHSKLQYKVPKHHYQKQAQADYQSEDNNIKIADLSNAELGKRDIDDDIKLMKLLRAELQKEIIQVIKKQPSLEKQSLAQIELLLNMDNDCIDNDCIDQEKINQEHFHLKIVWQWLRTRREEDKKDFGYLIRNSFKKLNIEFDDYIGFEKKRVEHHEHCENDCELLNSFEDVFGSVNVS